uniref:spermatogenesis-associated protein 33-like isoform X2 n=1 Tax=Jaculus jaculus TaxID=51337 RepID=UPI001E1B2F89|nr:spermatogenesis-associated protein 33-like isoform X2 [Jaculus jaculus]
MNEEQQKTPTHSVPKAEDKMTEEAKQGDKTLNQTSDNLLGSGSSRHPRPSVSFKEKPDAKQKASKKKAAIPKIVITPPSTEMLMGYGLSDNEEQKAVREHTVRGPY